MAHNHDAFWYIIYIFYQFKTVFVRWKNKIKLKWVLRVFVCVCARNDTPIRYQFKALEVNLSQQVRGLGFWVHGMELVTEYNVGRLVF